MDFGIKAAALTGLQVYETASRRTGRTETTLRALKDGDIVLVGSANEVRRIDRILRERKIKVRIVSVDGMRRDHLSGMRGRLFVDHTAYSAMMADAINSVDAELQSLRLGVEPSSERLEPVMSFAYYDNGRMAA
jgi:hypothetical protein